MVAPGGRRQRRQRVRAGRGTPRLPRGANKEKAGEVARGATLAPPAPSSRQRRDPRSRPGGTGPRLPRGRGNAQNLSLYPGPAGRPKGPKEGLAGATGRLQDAARGVDLRGGEGSPGVSGRLPPQRPSGAPPGSPRACGIRAVFISQARGALELSTGGRPAWAQANLRVVGALAAGAALCGCGAGFKSMIPVFSSWLMQAALNDTQRRTL